MSFWRWRQSGHPAHIWTPKVQTLFIYQQLSSSQVAKVTCGWLKKKNPEQDINVQGTMLSGTVQVLRKVLKNWHGHLREDDFPLRQTEVYKKSSSKKVHGMTAPWHWPTIILCQCQYLLLLCKMHVCPRNQLGTLKKDFFLIKFGLHLFLIGLKNSRNVWKLILVDVVVWKNKQKIHLLCDLISLPDVIKSD